MAVTIFQVPIPLGNSVVAFANYLNLMAGVLKVVISQIYYQVVDLSTISVTNLTTGFSCTPKMHAATKSFNNIDLVSLWYLG